MEKACSSIGKTNKNVVVLNEVCVYSYGILFDFVVIFFYFYCSEKNRFFHADVNFSLSTSCALTACERY